MMDPLPNSPIAPGRTAVVVPSVQRTAAIAATRTAIITTAGLARNTADCSSASVAASGAAGTPMARSQAATPMAKALIVATAPPPVRAGPVEIDAGSGRPPSPRRQLPQDLDRLGGLGPPGVVRVGVHRSDDAVAIDHEPSGDGQSPRAVPVAGRQVDAEIRVDLLEILGQREDQPALLGHPVAEVAEHLVAHGLGLVSLTPRARHLG